MTKLTDYQTYPLLKHHFQTIHQKNMMEWFAKDDNRFKNLSLETCGILLDYSKNRLTEETITLLCTLAHESELAKEINALFSGEMINITEKRPALHTALRNPDIESLYVAERNIVNDIKQTSEKINVFIQQIHSGEWHGVSGLPITDIVNIGIGGSHLGPQVTSQALSVYAKPNLRCHFISNMDDQHVKNVLSNIHPETTLFIISSKSFSTFETLYNAKKIYNWMHDQVGKEVNRHFVAVTAHPEKAIEFGIPADHIFPLWEWVGGRYSIWSAIGLPLAILIGVENFRHFLQGAYAMDNHFREAPYEKNMPIILALIGIWYINFFHASQHAIIPYTEQLALLPDYLQQLDMESNGKCAHIHDYLVDYPTGPVIFGKHGGDSQHSYFQLLHQGQHFIPVDFIVTGEQEILFASALSQAQALMCGLFDPVIHKYIPGNRPSNILFLNNITPFNMGALLALYEHKIFVQGKLWGINSFDQWGVELGKKILPNILDNIRRNQPNTQDSSTQGLIRHYHSTKTRA